MTTPKRPIIRFMGGKWMLAPWIISHFPAHRAYVEPFGGGGSVLLRKPRAYAEVYNDIDDELVNLFAIVRDRGDALRRQLELTPFARNEFLMSYEPAHDSIERARRTVVRAFMGFGCNSHGVKCGFRANSNRSGSTPAHDWRNLPDAIGALTERLRGVVIENKDACEVMANHDTPQTLHYVDPPYVQKTRGKNRYRFEMSESDHEDLAMTLNSLQGMVVLSGYRCDLYDTLYTGWPRAERKVYADGASPRTECLWFRNVHLQPTLI